MTPIESKNSSNVNRVRCFSQDALVETALSTKWKFIKIICSQPFNKHVQFGLSFIKVNVAENATNKESVAKSLVPEKFLLQRRSTDSNESDSKKLALGKFKVREDSPDSESETAAGLFNRWKMSRNKSSEQITAAAAIREASKVATLKKNIKPKQALVSPRPSTSDSSGREKDDRQLPDRNRELLLFGSKDEQLSNDRLEKIIEADKARLRDEDEKQEKQKIKKATCSNSAQPKIRHDEKSLSIITQTNSTIEKMKKRHSSPSNRPSKKNKTRKQTRYLPFDQLLKGVCLVISGIQNPDRAELRRKALEMGAKYRTDWEGDCTHLICAFKNTPKYNHVKGKGKIITRSWIENCYSMKRYLPWRRFSLDTSELAKPESDEEILDESQKPANESNEKLYEQPTTSQVKTNVKDKTLDMYDLGDEKEIRSHSQTYNITSGSDTEDEILRAKERKKRDSSGSNKENHKDDIYEVTTEEDDFLMEKNKICNKDTFFNGSNFFICDDVSIVDKIKLKKYIEQFGGSLSTELSNAQYAITNIPFKDNDKIKLSGEVVKPLWIFECADMEVMVPTARYKI